mmetsp:Transcript_7341/g.10871  ORF Transcript_7341/g.10871 Transcript_7341/m.10871 type:complete len:207 (+) Transcript_7341:327-947(+)
MCWCTQDSLDQMIWTQHIHHCLLLSTTCTTHLPSHTTLRLQTNWIQLLQRGQIHLTTLLHNLTNKLDHLLSPSLHSRQHFRMIGMFRLLHLTIIIHFIIIHNLIRNQTQTQPRHTRMMRCQYLWHRTHPNRISTQHSQHGTFTLTLILRSTHKRIRSIRMQILIKLQPLCHIQYYILQCHIIQVTRWWESWSQFVIVATHQWILST